MSAKDAGRLDLFSGSDYAVTCKSATISPCGNYRYKLVRRWRDGRLLPFVMLNPSTADAEIDDPTIRRCIGFARRESAAGIIVVNLYALRSTSPKVLRTAADPFGPDNAAALAGIAHATEADRMPIVCAWGAHGGVRGGDALALRLLAGAALVCLGKTKEGHPLHPLYQPAERPFEAFP